MDKKDELPKQKYFMRGFLLAATAEATGLAGYALAGGRNVGYAMMLSGGILFAGSVADSLINLAHRPPTRRGAPEGTRPNP